MRSIEEAVPSVLQSYIDFEINSQERLRARELYERLLERTSHVKVWLSYASFEAEPLPIDEDEDQEQQALASTSGAESPSNREAKARRLADTRSLSSLRDVRKP